MTRIRLLSAFQVLTLPEGSFTVVTTEDGCASCSHERAREVIREILDLDELPETDPTPQPSLEAYLAHWLGLELA